MARASLVRVAIAIAIAACGRLGFAPPLGDGAGNGGDGGDATPAAPANLVFVTSTMQPAGALGGLAGADALCQTRANAAGLHGTYVAWLSSTTTNAKDRIPASARGWTSVDGRPFADTLASLLAGQIFEPILKDELGNDLGNRDAAGTYVTTGTDTTGVYAGQGDCGGFTSTAAQQTSGGVTFGGTYGYTQGVLMACNVGWRITCFGVDRSTVVTSPHVSGRIAFLSSTWMSGGGIASADAQCASDAAAAGLPGTFAALLATSTATAASRFDTSASAAPWVRVDGVPVYSPASSLATGAPPLAGIDVTATGAYSSLIWAMTGAAAANVTTAGDSCTDWTSASANQFPAVGIPYESGPQGFYATTIKCSMAEPVFCFER